MADTNVYNRLLGIEQRLKAIEKLLEAKAAEERKERELRIQMMDEMWEYTAKQECVGLEVEA